MKRSYVILILVALVFSAAYSAFWFHQSSRVKQITEEAVVHFAKRFGGVRSNFVYSQSKISGFPFSFNVELSQPKLMVYEDDVMMDIYSAESLYISTNVIGTRFGVAIPIQVILHQKGEGDGEVWRAEFKDYPVLWGKRSWRHILQWMHGERLEEMKIEEVRYKDEGVVVTRQPDTTKIASTSSSFVRLLLQDGQVQGRAEVETEIKGLYLEWLDRYARADVPLGIWNVDMDLAYVPQGRPDALKRPVLETDWDIRKLVVNNKAFTLEAQGELGSEENDALPMGNVQLIVRQYGQCVDYYAAMINDVVQSSAFPVFKIEPDEAEAFKGFLNKVASERYNAGKDVLITLRRAQGEPLHIGEYSFAEAMQLFRKRTIASDSHSH